MKLFGKENESNKVTTLKIFEGIDDAVVEEILATAKTQNFLAGDTIIEQGTPSHSTGYIIKAGNVSVWVNGEHIATLTAGEMFGEIALLNEEERSASVIAESDVTTYLITQDMLFEMINNDDNSINKEIIRRMEENLLKEEEV